MLLELEVFSVVHNILPKTNQNLWKQEFVLFLIHQNKIEVGLVQVSSFWNFNNYLWNSILQCVKFEELMSFSALSKSRFGVGSDDYCLYCWSHKTADEVITVYRSDLKKINLIFMIFYWHCIVNPAFSVLYDLPEKSTDFFLIRELDFKHKYMNVLYDILTKVGNFSKFHVLIPR